jgi:ribosomal protein L11 methyltransferase
MSQWIEIALTALPEDAEFCAQILLEHGCDGAQIDDTNVRFDESEDATLEMKQEAEIRAYLAPGTDVDAIAQDVRSALQEAGVEAEVKTAPVPDEDWSTSWRQNFPPLEIGPFLVVPSWEEVEATDKVILRLDPGLAFGTGQHPTTHMCLELLAQEMGKLDSPRVFDVGCGSGILSIAAAKLVDKNGGTVVVASDLDPFCVEATKENAAVNDVSVEVHQEAGAAWTDEKFDLVIANLMSDLLIRLASEIAGVCKPEAVLVVSGISSPRADEVEIALHAAGFKTLQKQERDGESRGDYMEHWTAFVMQAA